MGSLDVNDAVRDEGATSEATHTHDIFVLGASAGGIQSLKALFATLPADFRGSIFVVLHISPEARSELAGIFSRAGTLPVTAPNDMAQFTSGHIYVASPDCHML